MISNEDFSPKNNRIPHRNITLTEGLEGLEGLKGLKGLKMSPPEKGPGDRKYYQGWWEVPVTQCF